MKKLTYSFFYFSKLFFISKKFDVIFYYPQHFNRGINDENLFFSHLYNNTNESDV